MEGKIALGMQKRGVQGRGRQCLVAWTSASPCTGVGLAVVAALSCLAPAVPRFQKHLVHIGSFISIGWPSIAPSVPQSPFLLPLLDCVEKPFLQLFAKHLAASGCSPPGRVKGQRESTAPDWAAQAPVSGCSVICPAT